MKAAHEAFSWGSGFNGTLQVLAALGVSSGIRFVSNVVTLPPFPGGLEEPGADRWNSWMLLLTDGAARSKVLRQPNWHKTHRDAQPASSQQNEFIVQGTWINAAATRET